MLIQRNEKDKYVLIEREITAFRNRSQRPGANDKVLEYFKNNLVGHLDWEDLECNYLSWRLGINRKNIKKYSNDTKLTDYVRRFNECFSSRTRIPEPSDIPEAPFEYPDLRLLSDEFEFPPHGVFPLGKFIDMTYRDYLTTPDSIKRVTLALSTSDTERRF